MLPSYAKLVDNSFVCQTQEPTMTKLPTTAIVPQPRGIDDRLSWLR